MDCKRLRELRRKAGLTQQEMALGAGITLSHYSKLERGKSDASLTTAAKLARHLGNLLPETSNILLELAGEER